MGPSEVTVNPYLLYSMLGVNILLTITILGALFRVLYVVGNLAGRVAALEKSLADFRQEMAAHIIRLDNRIDQLGIEMTALRGQLGARIDRVQASVAVLRDHLDARIDQLDARIDRVQASMAVFREQTGAALGELRGMVMALNQKIDLLMRHRHDAVSQDVLLTPAAPEIAGD